MIIHQIKEFIIKVFDEPTYNFGSADNNFNYSKHHFSDGGMEYPTSKHGIKIFKDDKDVSNCIIIGSGGATGVFQNSSLVDNDQFLICCCDTVFCLTLPDLYLKWKCRADEATCFQIIKIKDDYIIHGELQITKLSNEGLKKWEFCGTDIFVSNDNEDAFKIENEEILLTDFSKTKYNLDFDGKLLRVINRR